MDFDLIETIIKLLTALITFIVAAKSLCNRQDSKKPPKG